MQILSCYSPGHIPSYSLYLQHGGFCHLLLPACFYLLRKSSQDRSLYWYVLCSAITELLLDNNLLLGATKPWLVSFDSAGSARIGESEKHCHNHLQLWWQIFNNLVRPGLNKSAESSRDRTVRSCLATVTNSGYMESPPSPPSLPADNR